MADELQKLEHHGEPDPAGGGKPGKAAKPKGKASDHKEAIIVVLSTIGVLIAWLTYRRASSGSSTAAATAPVLTSGGGSTSGDVAGYGASSGDTSAGNGFQSYLQNLSDEISSLESNVSDLTTAVGQTQTAISNLPTASQPVAATSPTAAPIAATTTAPVALPPAPVATPAKPAPVAAQHAGGYVSGTGTYYAITNGLESITQLAKDFYGGTPTANEINDLRVQNNLQTTSSTAVLAAGTKITVPTVDQSKVDSTYKAAAIKS